MGDSSASRSKRPSTTKPHNPKCALHYTTVSVKCNGKTQRETACARNAVVFPVGYLPNCKQHAYQLIPAGRCQAVETCGQRCDRLAVADPPFHLCTKHEKGTNTLPCHLLKIPTELRFQIFRYVLPNRILCSKTHSSTADKSRWTSLLMINRQISEEAALVLYGEIPFRVNVSQELSLIHI